MITSLLKGLSSIIIINNGESDLNSTMLSGSIGNYFFSYFLLYLVFN